MLLLLLLVLPAPALAALAHRYAPLAAPPPRVSFPSFSLSTLTPAASSTGCFPALGFHTPAPSLALSTPLQDWWCDLDDEQGFLGFSYYVIRISSVEICKNSTDLHHDFSRMRNEFNARYVRLYSWCDDDFTFFDDVINAAYDVGIGVYATVWFGFDLTDVWMRRRDNITNILKSNPLAPYVVRSIDIGSEPLFDGVLPAAQLAEQVVAMQETAHPLGIGVSISELMFGFTSTPGAQAILDVVDFVHAHQLPFFDFDATHAAAAWPSVQNATDYFHQHTNGTKKIIFTQTGWPSTAEVFPPNSPHASPSLADSLAFAQLLDAHCEFMKSTYGHGGVGWFWQIYTEQSLPGWGWIEGKDGEAKVRFAPRTAC